MKVHLEWRRSNAVIDDASVKGTGASACRRFNSLEQLYRIILQGCVWVFEISPVSIADWINKAQNTAASTIEKIKRLIQPAVVSFYESEKYCDKRLG